MFFAAGPAAILELFKNSETVWAIVEILKHKWYLFTSFLEEENRIIWFCLDIFLP